MFKSIVIFEKEVAIKWESGEETFIPLLSLRNSCPCAWCAGEKDVFGTTYSGNKKNLTFQSYLLDSYEKIGLYGVRFFWKEGHKDGIYTYDLLKSLVC